MTKEYVANVTHHWYGERTDYTINGKHVGFSTSNGDATFKNWRVFNEIADLYGGDIRVCPKCQISFYVEESRERWESHQTKRKC